MWPQPYFLINQPFQTDQTIQNKNSSLTSFKKCNMCKPSLKFNVMLHFYIFSFFYIYKNKSIIEQLQSTWKSFFSVIM